MRENTTSAQHGPEKPIEVESPLTRTPMIHYLKSGATVIVTSPGHGFRFSDGTIASAQYIAVCDGLTCTRRVTPLKAIKGMAVNEMCMMLSQSQLRYLGWLCTQADIVLISFPVLTALREQGIRHQFPNALAMNSTAETQRAAPTDKVVDLRNWSY